MAKRGGFSGGMPGNMNNLMKQAQRMQRQMEETTKELEAKEYTATAGGGAVKKAPRGGKIQAYGQGSVSRNRNQYRGLQDEHHQEGGQLFLLLS